MVDFMQAHPGVTLTMIGLGWAAWYMIACWRCPFARCLRCKGAGRVYQSERRKTWRNCPRCKGTGMRRRIGRAIWAYFAASKKRATK